VDAVGTGASRLEQLGPTWASRAYAFCAGLGDPGTYVAGWIHEGGLRHSAAVSRGWLLAERSGGDSPIRSLVFFSSTGILMPVQSSDVGIEQIVDIARQNPDMVRVIVGERALVMKLWRRLAPLGFGERLARDQLVYSTERGSFAASDGPLALEVAGPRHLDQVVAASAAMAREEAQDDPQARNPTLFRDRIRTRLERGRDFIHAPDGEVCFKVNVSALSPLGGQIEGVYTVPALRRRHLGRRGVSWVTRWVLDRAERAVLLVNEDNGPARALYESLGYVPAYQSRTIFVAP
jgi:GNAT superfamily N-acetyltransferase